jgi:acetyl-CoA C-acetyltransferase
MADELCVVAARRTPWGRFLGGLQDLSPVDLAVAAGKKVLADAPGAVPDLVIVGNVLAAGHGMNIARQTGVRLGLPVEVPAYTVNMMCGSGLQAIRLGAQAIRAGEANTVLCGGTESMSGAAHVLPKSRRGWKLGDATIVDTLLRDGLVDAFDGRHMGLQAEDLARHFSVSRDAQDAWSERSQTLAGRAIGNGVLADEIVPVGAVATDEHPRPGTTRADLAKLKPAFDAAGTVTAGNASGLNDGAALLLLTRLAHARREGWPVLCRWVESTVVGCDPQWMGLGPVHALSALAQRCGRGVGDWDRVEINEAFAAQALACVAELGLDPERVNTHGGAIALGHPIGASGARLAVHLARSIARGECRNGAAALCVGGGMGIACALGDL